MRTASTGFPWASSVGAGYWNPVSAVPKARNSNFGMRPITHRDRSRGDAPRIPQEVQVLTLRCYSHARAPKGNTLLDSFQRSEYRPNVPPKGSSSGTHRGA